MPLMRDTLIISTVPIDVNTGAPISGYGGDFEISGRGMFAFLLGIRWREIDGSDKLKTDSQIIDLLSGVSKYVVFEIFDNLQGDSKIVLSPNRATIGKTSSAVLPPEWISYPNDDLRRAIYSDKFAKIAQDSSRWLKGGELKVPKETILRFFQSNKNGTAIENIEFAAAGKYMLNIAIEPGGMVSSGNPVVAKMFYLNIRCHFEFVRTPATDQFRQAEYEKWASELFTGLHKMIDD